MASLIPVGNLLGAFFLGVVFSSMCEATLNIMSEIDETEADCTALHAFKATLTFPGIARMIKLF